MLGLKDILEEATFFSLVLFCSIPPPLSLRRKGVLDEQREERKNDEVRYTKGVMIAGEGVVWSQIRRQLKSVGILQFFSLIYRATVATANSTPYLVCLLP